MTLTPNQLLMLIATCDREIGIRQVSTMWNASEVREAAHAISDIRSLAYGVLEGHEEETDLVNAMNEIDHHPLWVAVQKKEKAE